jgi:nucleotide-binding universal stress UspA family protein
MANKILIATDGSAYSQKAVDYGVGFAKKLNAGVIALYVVNTKSLEWYAMGHHDDIGGYEAAASALNTDGEKALEYAAATGKRAGVEVVTRITRGYPVEEILNMASTEGVSMIVVGNLGKTGIEHLLLGSVSEAIVKKAPCPVLVVRGAI